MPIAPDAGDSVRSRDGAGVDLAARADDWRRLAARLGVPFLDHVHPEPVDPSRPLPDPSVFARAEAMLLGEGPDALLVAAPTGERRAVTADMLARHPDLRRRFAVAAPREIRRALIESHASALDTRAREGLAGRDPAASAREAPTGGQVVILTIVLAVWLLTAVHLFGPFVSLTTAFFLLIGLFRAWMADEDVDDEPSPPLPDEALPTVAVLVPLHREAEVVADLVAALLTLDYPAERLDIRLVIEADDETTLAAAHRAVRAAERSAPSAPPIDVLAVRPSLPRTKPKALNVALATVDAEIVTVFDAEDRPAPDQLRRAAAAFAAGPSDLAVVQAALEIDHDERDRSWWVRQFEIEYAVLFHGLLPWLSRRRLFFPLGGTSNHFRREALDAVGGWDPDNVTEDVDVALRLARAGRSMATIPSETLEEAPPDWSAWRAQRVRWMKGWLQTWFVHMRDPGRLHRELGFRNTLIFHLVVSGQLASAFVFAPSVAILALDLVGVLTFVGDGLLHHDVVLLAGLVAFGSGVLGGLTAAVRIAGRRRRLRLVDILTIPFYWCALSIAAALAAVELVTAPGRWNKTTHGRVRRGRGDDPGLATAALDRSPLCAQPRHPHEIASTPLPPAPDEG